MKYATILLATFLSIVACNNAPKPIANTSEPINANQQSKDARTVLAHGSENQTPKPMNSNGSGRWSQSGDPIDTAAFDSNIAGAEKRLKEKADDEGKKNLAEAYFERGFALTEARQYAAALGDYRKALKYEPDHEESKKWIDQITSIYAMLKKEPPKEGSEPPPLPFKKAS